MSDVEPACPKCGATNPVSAHFCRACRFYLAGQKPAAAAAAPAATPTTPTPVAQAPPPPPPVPETPTAPVVDEPAIDPRTPPPTRPRPVPPPDVDEAVPPATQIHQAIRVPDAPVRQAEPAPGQVRCPTCGEITDATHRFCRFGHPIRDLTPDPVAAPAGPAPEQGPGITHHAKVAYDKGLSLRAHVVRIGLLAGALGLGVSMLPPWGFHVREFAGDQIGKLVPDEFEAVAVTAKPGIADVRGFPSKFAVDGEPTRAWATAWDAKAAVPKTCGAQSGAAGALDVRLPAGTKIDRITVLNGLPDDNPNVGKYATPKAIDVVVPQGPCTRIPLDEGAKAQHHSIHLDGTKEAFVQVVSVYPAKAGPSTVVALSELQFEKKK